MKYFLEKVAVSYPGFSWGDTGTSIYIYCVFGSEGPPTLVSKEALVQRRSVKKLFLEISQNSQENTCNRVSF